MAGLFSLFLFLLPFLISSPAASSPTPTAPSSDGVVGVIYGMNTPALPPPEQVVNALIFAGVPRVFLVDAYPEGVAAFNHTGIPLIISINNTYLAALATNKTEAFRWIGASIMVTNITVEAIAVGYSVLTEHLDLADLLLPALKNLRAALSTVGIDIPITTANNYELLSTGYPPSAAEFNTSVVETYVKPLLAFLNATNAPFLTTAFPYRLFRSGAVSLTDTAFVNFEADEVEYLTDPKTGLVYTNLFEAMVDAAVTAMGKLGYDRLPVVVSGTGWPSAGGPSAPEASILFAAEYNERLVVRLNMRKGTPLRPGVSPPTYIYGLFDEPSNGGDEVERNWGIWALDLEQRYVIDFTPAYSGGAVAQGLPGKTLLPVGGIVSLVLLWFLCE